MRLPTWAEALAEHEEHKASGANYREWLYTYTCPGMGCGKKTSVLGMDFPLILRFDGLCADCASKAR